VHVILPLDVRHAIEKEIEFFLREALAESRDPPRDLAASDCYRLGFSGIGHPFRKMRLKKRRRCKNLSQRTLKG
jgi:hypothetical protein